MVFNVSSQKNHFEKGLKLNVVLYFTWKCFYHLKFISVGITEVVNRFHDMSETVQSTCENEIHSWCIIRFIQWKKKKNFNTQIEFLPLFVLFVETFTYSYTLYLYIYIHNMLRDKKKRMKIASRNFYYEEK